jgi:predicted DNA-binding protein (MmcQ/YjbR family)
MTIDTVRTICRALPDATEDIKWEHDLVFSVGGKMFAVVRLEPPHTVAFKCTPEAFAELIERDGIIPAPYLARAMWVQDQGVAEPLDRRELAQLIRGSYDLVLAKLPKRRRPVAPAKAGSPARDVNPAKEPAKTTTFNAVTAETAKRKPKSSRRSLRARR